MTKINCLMIGKDRHITLVKVDAKRSDFVFCNGLYTMPATSVNLAEDANEKFEPYPELIYFVGNPLPITSEKSNNNATGFLKQTVLANNLRQTAHAKSEFMSIIFDYLRNPSKLIMLTFVGIIIAAVVGGFLTA